MYGPVAFVATVLSCIMVSKAEFDCSFVLVVCEF